VSAVCARHRGGNDLGVLGLDIETVDTQIPHPGGTRVETVGALTPLCHHRRMDKPNMDSMRWHPAAGQIRKAGGAAAGEVVDLATKRAMRLLAAAGMVAPAAVTRRRRNVR
jgi:hypothetical protein